MKKASFTETVRAEIRRRGRISFAEFMGWALAHPRWGYYAGPSRTGRSGDFITNVQVPLFGELISSVIVNMWDALGSERFTLVELGAGDGALAERILADLERRGRGRRVTLHLVELSRSARESARRRLSRFRGVQFHAALSDLEHTAGVEGCVYSNEFFDALPFHRVRVVNGELTELYVADGADGLRETPGPLSSPDLARGFEEERIQLAEGQSAEVGLAVDDVYEALERLLARGFVLSVDYGGPAAAVYDSSRPQGSRRTFSRHRVADDPFRDIGEKDITAHVDFTRMARAGLRRGFRPIVYADQGPFLLAGAEAEIRSAVEGPAPRGREVRQLVHPSAFGGAFHVLVQSVNAEGSVLRCEKAARLQRLGLSGG